jgi:putative transcription antitermination factor YqgF
MSRIVCFDVGDKYIGVAHSDSVYKMAFPHDTWEFSLFNDSFEKYLVSHSVELVVVGYPMTLGGEESQQTKKIMRWKEEKERIFSISPFIFFDERLSSKFAHSLTKGTKNKHSNHAQAAAIILSNYLNNG